MTKITGSVRSAPRTVPAGTTFSVTVRVDNKALVEPVLAGTNCGGGGMDLSGEGEKIKVVLRLLDTSGNQVDRATKDVCAAYQTIGSDDMVTLTARPPEPGQYVVDVHLEGYRDRVNIATQPENFSITATSAEETEPVNQNQDNTTQPPDVTLPTPPDGGPLMQNPLQTVAALLVLVVLVSVVAGK